MFFYTFVSVHRTVRHFIVHNNGMRINLDPKTLYFVNNKPLNRTRIRYIRIIRFFIIVQGRKSYCYILIY